MEMMNPWVKQGWEEGMQSGRQAGIQAGKEDLVVRQLNRRFGTVSAEVMERIDHLSSEQLNELGVDLLDFKVPADLKTWLSRHNGQQETR